VRRTRLWIGLVFLGVASVACSAILDLQAPPSPQSESPVDAAAPTADAREASTDATEGPTGDGGPPPVCAALDAVGPGADASAKFHAIAGGDGGPGSWALFDTMAVGKRAQSFAGGTFDGRYVYFAPATNGVITRLDTAAAGGFQVAASWSTFDIAALPGASGAGGFSGAWFDGRYVYFVPHGLGGVQSGLVVRFDATGSFASAASWATFDTSSLDVDGGAATKGFSGAGSDGHYVYFVPNNDGAPDGRVVRYDASRLLSAPSLDGGHPDAGDVGTGDAAAGDAGAADAATADAGTLAGTFADPSLWATFDVSSTIPGAAGFTGAIFDGRSLYLVPSNNGGLGDNGFSGIAARFKTDAGFASAGSWSALDLTTINGEAVGFSGAAFDGRYLYFVPHLHGIVLRLDTTSSQPTSPSAWSVFDVAPLTPIDAGTPQFAGAAFDGRFVYFVPSTPGFGVVTRYDTLSTFASSCAWSTFDLTQLDPAASFYLGAVFDGQYVYFVPRGGGLVARFDAKTPPSQPNLPAFHGSFY
jgi:hypothetical protein